MTEPINSALGLADHAAWNEEIVARNNPKQYLFNSRWIVRLIEAQRVRSICRLLQSQTRHSVMEIGCGSGHILGAMPGHEKHGVDLSRRMIARAQEVVPQGIFRIANADQLPYSDGAFDRVFCTSVLSHVQNPEVVLNEAYRVVRPGGRLVITVSNEAFIGWGMRMAARLRLDGGSAQADRAFEPTYHIQQFDPERFQRVIRTLPDAECIEKIPSRFCPVHFAAVWQR